MIPATDLPTVCFSKTAASTTEPRSRPCQSRPVYYITTCYLLSAAYLYCQACLGLARRGRAFVLDANCRQLLPDIGSFGL